MSGPQRPSPAPASSRTSSWVDRLFHLRDWLADLLSGKSGKQTRAARRGEKLALQRLEDRNPPSESLSVLTFPATLATLA